MIDYLLLLFSIFSVVGAQLLLKKGMALIGSLEFNLSNFLNLIIKTFTNFYILSGLCLFGISFFVWLFVISRFKLSMIYPINTSAAFALIAIFSWIFFKESLQLIQIIGIIIIVFGIFLVAK